MVCFLSIPKKHARMNECQEGSEYPSYVVASINSLSSLEMTCARHSLEVFRKCNGSPAGEKYPGIFDSNHVIAPDPE